MKKIYFENFDGLRTIAFLMVFFSHTWRNLYYSTPFESLNFYLSKLFDVGSLGVNLFFVLSGFLITYLLLIEKKDTGTIDIKNFYFRRILRIWPVYFTVVIAGIFFLPLLIPALREEFFAISPSSIARYLFFMVNFDHILYGIDFRWASVLWSVSVEEQFYLIWPLVLLVTNKKNLPYVLWTFIIISFSYRFMHFGSYRKVNYHTIACMGDLAMGAFGAYMTFFNEQAKSLFSRIPIAINISIYIFGAILLIFRNEIFSGQYLVPFIGLLGSTYFLYIILEQSYNQLSFFKMENSVFMTNMGKYTYGLYCYHFFAIFFVNFFRGVFGLNPKNTGYFLFASLFALLLSYIIAKVSYYKLELPFLRLKQRFSYVTR